MVTTSERVVVRRCPRCGGKWIGRPGLEWFTCARCAGAIDPFHEPARTMKTWRPEKEPEDRVARLAFYVFHLGPASSPVAEERVAKAGCPPAPRGRRRTVGHTEGIPGVAWVNAFRVAGIQMHGDAGARLTERGHDPECVEAPLGAGLARGPGEALRLLRARLGLREHEPLDVQSVRLVSLGCLTDGDSLREPVSGLVYPRSVVLPTP